MNEKKKFTITKKQQLTLIKALTAELTSLRAKVGISQSEIAAIIGVSRQTYSSIECGKRLMSWSTYLSLVFFFDHNNATHQLIREIKAFPEELIVDFNDGGRDPYSASSAIAGIPRQITEKLDGQALHAIRTVVMMEYARCENMTGDEVVKAFEGYSVKPTVTENDKKTRQALSKIKEGKKQ